MGLAAGPPPWKQRCRPDGICEHGFPPGPRARRDQSENTSARGSGARATVRPAIRRRRFSPVPRHERHVDAVVEARREPCLLEIGKEPPHRPRGVGMEGIEKDSGGWILRGRKLLPPRRNRSLGRFLVRHRQPERAEISATRAPAPPQPPADVICPGNPATSAHPRRRPTRQRWIRPAVIPSPARSIVEGSGTAATL